MIEAKAEELEIGLEELAKVQNGNRKERSLKGLVSTGGKIDLWQVLALLFILSWAALVSVVLYWLLIDDTPPLTINEARPIKTESYPGGIVTYFADVCKHTTAHPTKSMSWIDGFVLPVRVPQPSAGERVACKAATTLVSVPSLLPPDDDYYLELTWTYDINPIKQRSVSTMVGPFSIKEK